MRGINNMIGNLVGNSHQYHCQSSVSFHEAVDNDKISVSVLTRRDAVPSLSVLQLSEFLLGCGRPHSPLQPAGHH